MSTNTRLYSSSNFIPSPSRVLHNYITIQPTPFLWFLFPPYTSNHLLPAPGYTASFRPRPRSRLLPISWHVTCGDLWDPRRKDQKQASMPPLRLSVLFWWRDNVTSYVGVSASHVTWGKSKSTHETNKNHIEHFELCRPLEFKAYLWTRSARKTVCRVKFPFGVWTLSLVAKGGSRIALWK